MATSHVIYKLMNNLGYKFSICQLGKNVYDDLAYYNKDNFPDIEITRPNIATDLTAIHNKALVTVNGYIYPTTYYNDKLYVANATKSMLKSRSNHIGLLSFLDLSNNINKLPIQPSMITTDPPFTLYQKAIITFNRDIGNFILSVCGYPIFENSEFLYRVSSNAIAIRLDRLNMLSKIYELSRYRDIITELEIPSSINNPSQISLENVYSEDTVVKFLSTFNSFLIEVPCDTLTTSPIYLERSHLPGIFTTQINKSYPIIVGNGKFSEHYVKRAVYNFDLSEAERPSYKVHMNDAYYNNYAISSTSFSYTSMFNSSTLATDNYRLNRAFFLDIQMEN